MDSTYARRARRALYIVVIGGLVAVPILVAVPKANVQGVGWAALYISAAVVWLVCSFTYWYGFWVFAKAKGYSGLFGLFLGLLTFIGLIILFAMKDRKRDVPAASA